MKNRAQLRWKKKPSNAWDDFEAIFWNMKLITRVFIVIMIICFTCSLFASMKIFGGKKPKQRCRKVNTLIYISEWIYRFSVRSTAHIDSNAVILLRYMNKCILPLSLSVSYIYFHSFLHQNCAKVMLHYFQLKRRNNPINEQFNRYRIGSIIQNQIL